MAPPSVYKGSASGPHRTSNNGVNSFFGVLASGVPFVGESEDVDRYSSVAVAIFSNIAGILYIEFSVDEANWDSSEPISINASTDSVKIRKATRRYYRTRFVPGTATDTVVRLSTRFGQFLGEVREGDSSSGSSGSSTSDSNIIDDRMNPSGGTQAHVSHFGALKVGEFTPVVSANFPGSSLNTAIWTETTVGSGSVTVASGTGDISTGTDSNGSTKIISVTRGEFFAGVVTVYQSGVAAGVGVANNTRRWGLMDTTEQNGLFFELSGTTFQVTARKAGVDTSVIQSSFNGDQTFTPGANNNTYRIHYSAGRAIFQRADGGNIVTLHTMVRSDLPLVDDLDLHLYYENTNTGNTTDVSMVVRGASSGVIGKPPYIKPRNITRDINLDTVLKPTASVGIGELPDGSFDDIHFGGKSSDNNTTTPLIANATFTGQWELLENYVAIGVVIVSDQVSSSDGIEIQFSDDAVSVDHKVVRTFDASDVTAGSKFISTSGRMNYFRIVYTNGGTGQSTFKLLTRLETSPFEIPSDAIEGALNGTNIASMSKSVIAAKNDLGTYGNIERADLGGLRTAINEFETDVPIRPLTAGVTNQANVTTSASIVITATANRKTISIKALGSNNRELFIGFNSGLTTGNGYELNAGDSVDIEIDDTVGSIYGITSSGTQRVCWMELT